MDASNISKNKLASTLNKHNDCVFDLLFNLSAEEIGASQISSDVVLQAFDRLRAGKKDHSFLIFILPLWLLTLFQYYLRCYCTMGISLAN